MSTKSVQQPELTIAPKVKFPREDALAVVRKATTILVSQRKKLLTFDATSSDDDIAAVILGRSGNLRVPTIHIGDTVIVGYHEDAYQQLFGE